MEKPSNAVKVEVSSTPEEDEFWLSFGQSLISNSIDTLDSRAQFMVTTSASLIAVDFAILTLVSKVTTLAVSPQLAFALSALCFILSFVPKRYQVNPWLPDKTRFTYLRILEAKYKWHLVGFSLFFSGLVLIALSSFWVIA